MPCGTPIRPSTSTAAARSRSAHRASRDARGPVPRVHARRRAGVHARSPSSPTLADDYTWRANTVAVVTDGTAVLGLGDIGPAAALPVMEGKALLFKQFGGVDAVPICLDCTDVDEIVETVVRLAPSFGGINLEDISRTALLRDRAPAAGAAGHPGLPRRPARHRHRRARRAAQRRPADRPPPRRPARRGRRGAGAAGSRSTRILLEAGIGDIAVADRKGVVHHARGRT